MYTMYFGYLHDLHIDTWFTLKSLTDVVCHLFYLFWLVGKGMAYCGLPFPASGCPVPDLTNIYLIGNVLCMGFCFYNCPPIFVVSAHGLSFKKRMGLVSMDILHIIFIYTILRIISRSVSGLATDSSCGVWGRGWTTCFLCDGPILGLCF